MGKLNLRRKGRKLWLRLKPGLKHGGEMGDPQNKGTAMSLANPKGSVLNVAE